MVVQLVCGLDKRLGWSADVSVAQQVSAAVASVAGVAITAWAMAVNRYFSAVVRIQTDRGHSVVAAGPYRYVRHPGYAGMLLVTLSGPILLGTLWGLVPAGLVAGTFVLRSALEDRTLRRELAGYADYARDVRSRLIPAVW
jgi:protein-S-isoprenylcysteine O-methyltransferase Ste14